MNKLTKKLFLAAVSTLFAVVALGSTTFAWFTLTQSATVSQYTLDISSNAGVKVAITNSGITSLTGLTAGSPIYNGTDPTILESYFSGFGQKISMKDIELAIGEKDEAVDGKIDKVHLAALAGRINTDGLNHESFEPLLLTNYYTALASKAPVANVDYLAFKLWFLVETMDTGDDMVFEIIPEYGAAAVDVDPFTLQENATIDGEDTTESPGNQYVKGAQVSVSAANAMRIVTTHAVSGVNEVRSFATADNTPHSGTSTNPQYVDLGGYLPFAESRALQYYHNRMGHTSSYKAVWSLADNHIEIPKVGSSTSREEMAAYHAIVLEQTAATLAGFNQPDAFEVSITNTAGNMGNAMIGVEYVMYLDGWDADCFDAIFRQAVAITLKFDVEKK